LANIWSAPLGSFALALLLFSFECRAVSVLGIAPYTLDGNATTFRYAAGAVTDIIDTVSGFTLYNMTFNRSNEVGTDRGQLITFLVRSSTASPASTTGNTLAVVVQVETGITSTPYLAIPIAYAFNNSTGVGGDCDASDSSGNYCQGTIVNTRGDGQKQDALTEYEFAAKYSSGNDLVIGFYLDEICAWSASQGLTLTDGCTLADVDVPTTAVATKFRFRVAVVTESLASPTVQDVADTAELSPVIRVIAVNGTATTLACPSLSEIYTPGDTEILIEASRFALTLPVTGEYPGLEKIVVVGNPEADGACGTAVAVSTAANFGNPAVNALNSRLDLGGIQRVRGFTNASALAGSPGDNCFSVAFGLRDNGGGVKFDAPTCQIDGVQTVGISGFLNDSRCFIASAAFRSSDAPPVLLLRRFRDEVLRHLPFGAGMIEAYYIVSPPAARWLDVNPAFRLHVLTAFFPIVALAWIATSPFVLLGLLVCAVLLLGFSASLRFSTLTVRLGGVLLLVASVAQGEPVSNQPYIDQVKRGWKEKPAAVQADPSVPDPYLQSIKKKQLPTSYPNESYIEHLRKSDPSLQRETPSTFLDREKEKMTPKETRSAIADTKSGRSQVRAKKEGKIRNAAGFRVGAAVDRAVARPGGTTTFTQVYGNKWVPDITAFFEYQPFHSEWLGNVGVVASFGFTQNRGSGQFAFAPNRPPILGGTTTFSTKSSTNFNFISLPLVIGANYRFNLARIIRPYAQIGAAAIGYIETRDDQKKGNRGYSNGYSMSVGANLKLDWLDKTTSWDLYQSSGIQQYYLTIDYTRLATLAGPVDFTVSGFSAGLTYEF